MAGYPLEFGWHTDLPDTSAAPKIPTYTAVMPTLLGGADPATIGLPPVDTPDSTASPPDPKMAQSILPFLGKPKYYVRPRPPVSRPSSGSGTPENTPAEEPRHKVPVPGQSGKEAKDDIPGWARQEGIRPRMGEKPRDTAKRAMDEKYGEGNWDQPKRWKEFNKLHKHYREHYQDPKSIPGPYEGPFGIPGQDRVAETDGSEENIQPDVA